MTDFTLNVCYFLFAICCVYKLAWIATQVADRRDWPAFWLRTAALIYGAMLLTRASTRFAIFDPASILDVTREFALCLFLIAAISAFRSAGARETEREKDGTRST